MSTRTSSSRNASSSRFLRMSLGFLLLTLLLFLVITVLLDAQLNQLSLTAQRWIVFLTLVLPPGLGAIAGLLALVQKPSRVILALLGFLLNALIAAYFLLLLGFAG